MSGVYVREAERLYSWAVLLPIDVVSLASVAISDFLHGSPLLVSPCVQS
jgi:hypothetical protein